MVSVIVFSKDRTLQLHGYLESLLFYSDVKAENITVYYKDSKKIPYDKVISSFPEVKWVRETNFIKDLKKLVTNANDFIMFGCDDVVFKSDFSTSQATDVLFNNDDIFGFSMRLGKNIKPMPKNFIKDSEYLQWKWKDSPIHWNYPWELDCTIYRKKDVLKIINDPFINLKNPNYLEGEVAANIEKYVNRSQLASFKKGKSIIITVNRVQDTHLNDFDSSMQTDIETLHNQYLNGLRMDIEAISNMKNKIMHVDSKYLLLTDKPLGYKSFLNILQKYINKRILILIDSAFTRKFGK